MARFQEKRSPSVFRGLQLSVCMFVLIFALFFFGISHLSEDTALPTAMRWRAHIRRAWTI